MNRGHHIYLEKTGQAPSPSKDFHQLIVQDHEVIWRTWKISLRKDLKAIPPSQKKISWEDFDYDDIAQLDIARVFGEDTLRLVHGLVCGDWLVRLPESVVVHIASYLDLVDIARLGSLCKFLRKVCSSNELWEKIYRKHCDTVTKEIQELAHEVGWKKTFFTNRLQLQVQVRRRKEKNSADLKLRAAQLAHREEPVKPAGTAFLTQTND
ncbi:F-box only protein 36-like [Actinia tenebrosa]|uniref:F-box only protein 36-like n=1 Tax=Actinia tenebrosa TaxID=6105 RepID=A0A6P8I4U9_ACTTE|nr:F-box only protein 36-like [Actinia tenebrosa]